MIKKGSRNLKEDVPDVRADEPERAMEQFTDGLRRVLAAPKTPRNHPSQKTKRQRQRVKAG